DDGVAKVADVRGLVRVNARVLDHALRTFRRYGDIFNSLAFNSRRRDTREHERAVVEEVEITRARDLDARDLTGRLKLLFKLFGDGARVALLARRLLDALRKLEGDGEGEIAEFRARRDFGCDVLKLHAESRGGGRAHAL